MMIYRTFFAAVSLVALLFIHMNGSLEAQERITLRDGTIISGELLRMSGDTLFFKTSFIDVLPIGRDKIMSIEFDTEIDIRNGSSTGFDGSSGIGKLMVIITGPEMTTSIRFRRGNDRVSAIEANKIIFRITANGKVIYEKIDDVIDADNRSEGWTILKNKFQFGRYEVSLPAGEYRINIYAGNDMANEYRQKFDTGVASLSKTKDNVRVYKDEMTTLVLKSNQPFLRPGSYDLKWVE